MHSLMCFVVGAVSLTGCASETTEPVSFELTMENISSPDGVEGTMGLYVAALSPGLVLVTPDEGALLVGGTEASESLERFAEEGDPLPLVGDTPGALILSKGYNTTYETAPLFPGESTSLTFEGAPGDRLHFAVMYGESNDTLVATDSAGVALFEGDSPINGDVSSVRYWDCGTEVNEAPGFGANQPPRQAESGEDEGGTVTMLEGSSDGTFDFPSLSSLVRVTISS